MCFYFLIQTYNFVFKSNVNEEYYNLNISIIIIFTDILRLSCE